MGVLVLLLLLYSTIWRLSNGATIIDGSGSSGDRAISQNKYLSQDYIHRNPHPSLVSVQLLPNRLLSVKRHHLQEQGCLAVIGLFLNSNFSFSWTVNSGKFSLPLNAPL